MPRISAVGLLAAELLLSQAAGLPLPAKHWCSEPGVPWERCGVDGGQRVMEQLPGIVTSMPAWWESMPEYVRQCPTCEPIWMLCPSEDTGGWDGGDMLRLGSMMMLEHINRQQWLLPGYELMCEYYNDGCEGTAGQKIVMSRVMNDSSKYVAIAQSGCSGVAGTIATYTPTFNMPFVSWAAGMPDLTSRESYPNFFRTRIPHTSFTYAWLKVAELCGWKKIVLILAEERRFRGHFELMKREIHAAGREVALEARILFPLLQADDLLRTIRSMRLRVIQMITYENTWRALLCSSRSLGMRGLVWMVYGFYSPGFYNVLDQPDLSQWGCGKAELRELADAAIFVTSTMWAQKPERPVFCDRDQNLTTAAFEAAYLQKAAQLSTDEMVARGGHDYRASRPRDAGAQAADGACLYAQVFSAMLAKHPGGRRPFSGNSYTLDDMRARGADVYEDINQLLQASTFDGVSGSPFSFNCEDMPADGRCDAECRNNKRCTGDPNGATIVFQFNKDGKEGDSDGMSPTSEFPRVFIYDRALELAATTPEESSQAYDWKAALRFPWGALSGGAAAGAQNASSPPGTNGQPCVEGYHVVNGTSYCVPDDMMPLCRSGSVLRGEFCHSCLAHTVHDANLGLCVACEPGTTQPLEGQTSCDLCPGGTASNTTHRECLPCRAGMYGALRVGGRSECTACGKGEHSSQPGMVSCELCPVGTFADAEGSADCTSCAARMTTLNQGSTEASECVCAPNHYPAAGESEAPEECIACPVGRTSSAGQSECSIDGRYIFLLSLCVVLQYIALRPLLRAFRRSIRIQDVSQLGDKVVVTTFLPHRIVHAGFGKAAGPAEISATSTPSVDSNSSHSHQDDEWDSLRGHTRVVLQGTWHEDLDGKSFLAKALDPTRLELRSFDQTPMTQQVDASMGSLVQPFPYDILHSTWHGVPSLIFAIFLPMPWIALAVEEGSGMFDGHEDDAWLIGSLVILITGVIAVIVSAWKRQRYPGRFTPLQQRIRDFSKLLLGRNPDPRPSERGAGRAVSVDSLTKLLHFFSDFIQDRTAYYLNSNITLPLTAPYQLSFSELAGPELLMFFVSHFWGTPFRDFVATITEHARNCGIPSKLEEVSYWVCFLSNNQWRISEELGDGDWRTSSFYMALWSPSCLATCMVLDDQALPLTRAWCLFEVLQTYKHVSQTSMQTPRHASRDTLHSFEGLYYCTKDGVIGLQIEDELMYDVSISLARRLATLDVADATASRQEDYDMIVSLIGEEGGMEQMNAYIRRHMLDDLDKVQSLFLAEMRSTRRSLTGSGNTVRSPRMQMQSQDISKEGRSPGVSPEFGAQISISLESEIQNEV